MLYSGSDERVQVSVDGTPRRFVHDESGRVIGEYGATGTVFAEHVWLMPDTEEGGWEPLALLGASTLSYVHGDHPGAPVGFTDASGARVNAVEFPSCTTPAVGPSLRVSSEAGWEREEGGVYAFVFR
jgi:hypothetical protein